MVVVFVAVLVVDFRHDMHQGDEKKRSNGEQKCDTGPPVESFECLWVIDWGLALQREHCVRDKGAGGRCNGISDQEAQSLQEWLVHMYDEGSVSSGFGGLVEEKGKGDH